MLLTETGFLRLAQILGVKEVTASEAEANRIYNAQKAERCLVEGRVDRRGTPVFARRPTTPRKACPAIVPVSASAWWAGIRQGHYPKPVKIGGSTFWKVDDIRALIASGNESGEEL